LTLPGSVIEDDLSNAKYDIAKGILEISISKVTPGEIFQDLDMTNRLLAKTGEILNEKDIKGPPRIQLISSDSMDEKDDELFNFEDTISIQIESSAKYGFNDQYSGVFSYLQNPEVLCILECENKTAMERWKVMRDQEDVKFDKEWYFADRFEVPEELNEILQYTIPSALYDSLTFEEQNTLRNLGNKECFILFCFGVNL
jgi:protein SHQ1